MVEGTINTANQIMELKARVENLNEKCDYIRFRGEGGREALQTFNDDIFKITHTLQTLDDCKETCPEKGYFLK
jgi:hypothetical protein